ncbi:MAG: hypothetical protein ACLU38_09810 [Dysosmobacter sp.]
MRSSPLPAIGIAVAVSCLIAFLVCMILKGQVKSVRKGVDANVYTTAGGGLKLTDSYDHYTHTTETRRKIESDSGGGGRSSGGTVSRSGGGWSRPQRQILRRRQNHEALDFAPAGVGTSLPDAGS